MEILIVSIGLLIVSMGVALSWYQKGATGIWATYVFGFLIVLTNGPISDSLKGFSVTGSGLKVDFSKVSSESAEIAKINKNTIKSIESMAVSSDQKSSKKDDTYAKVIIAKVIPFIKNLGYTPTQIVGSPNIRPGSIVAVSNEGLILWASQEEAFPKLVIQSTSVAFPTFQFENPLSTNNSMLKFMFECNEGAIAEEASISGLRSSWNQELSKQFSASNNLFVVQSVLLCNGLRMASSQRGNDDINESRQDFDYRAAGKAVLGYKLVQMELSNK